MWGSTGQQMGRSLGPRKGGRGPCRGKKKPKIGSASGREVEKEPTSGGNVVREMDGTGPRGTGRAACFSHPLAEGKPPDLQLPEDYLKEIENSDATVLWLLAGMNTSISEFLDNVVAVVAVCLQCRPMSWVRKINFTQNHSRSSYQILHLFNLLLHSS